MGARKPLARKTDQSAVVRRIHNEMLPSRAMKKDITEQFSPKEPKLPSNRQTARRLERSRTMGAGLSSPGIGATSGRRAGTARKNRG